MCKVACTLLLHYFILVTVFGLAKPPLNLQYQIIYECQQIYKLQPKDTVAAVAVPEDKKCYFYCVFERLQIMRDDAVPNIETFRKLHPSTPEYALDHYNHCINTTISKDKCDRARDIQICLEDKLWSQFMEYEKQCLRSQNVTIEDERNFRIPDCFFLCMSIKMNKMTEKGEITVEKFESSHPEVMGDMAHNLEDCAKTIKRDTPCKTAKALNVCLTNRIA